MRHCTPVVFPTPSAGRALSAWAEPRATRRIEFDIWVDADASGPALNALDGAGVRFDSGAAAREAVERGMFVGVRGGEYRVDVFVPSIPFYEEARRRVVRIRFLDREIPVLSAETLAVFKLLFFRPKDLVDLQRLLELRADSFGAAFVREEVAAMMGEGDSRIAEWDRIVLAARGGP